MTRIMYDSVTPKAIPRNAALVAGYLRPSRYVWSPSDWDMFPNSRKVRIAISASTNDGHVLDVEPGDATPQQAVSWVLRRRATGFKYPAVYCNYSTWPAVRKAFRDAHVPEPLYWIARYDNKAQMIPGAIAKQYADPLTHGGGHYDLSIVADYWPGVDRPPIRPPLPGGDMPDLNDLLDTKVGTSSFDELGAWNDKPGTFGHFLLNQAQDMNYLRATLDRLVKKLEEQSS